MFKKTVARRRVLCYYFLVETFHQNERIILREEENLYDCSESYELIVDEHIKKAL